MAGHIYKIYGYVNSISGNSTTNPSTGTGSNGKWDLFTNYPVDAFASEIKPIHSFANAQISHEFTNHKVVINVYKDAAKTELISPTSGAITIEATDNGVDWGTVYPTNTTFDGLGRYERTSICGVVKNVRIGITGLRPREATNPIEGKPVGVFVEVLIYSSN